MRIKNGVIILKKKVFLIILCVSMIFFMIWGANYYTYHKYVGSSFKHFPRTLGTFVTDSDSTEYSYLVGKPALFEFSGCLSSSNENGTIGIVAWPRFMCNGIKEYGLILYKEDENNADKMVGYLLYVNADMSINNDRETGLEGSEHEEAISLYTAYYPQIMEQYRAMQNVFGLEQSE